LKKPKQIYEAWASMTKYKTASLYFHLAAAAMFFSLSSLILKTFFSIFVETPFLNWRCPEGC